MKNKNHFPFKKLTSIELNLVTGGVREGYLAFDEEDQLHMDFCKLGIITALMVGLGCCLVTIIIVSVTVKFSKKIFEKSKKKTFGNTTITSENLEIPKTSFNETSIKN